LKDVLDQLIVPQEKDLPLEYQVSPPSVRETLIRKLERRSSLVKQVFTIMFEQKEPTQAESAVAAVSSSDTIAVSSNESLALVTAAAAKKQSEKKIAEAINQLISRQNPQATQVVPNSVISSSASLFIQSIASVPSFVSGSSSLKLTMESVTRHINALMYMILNPIKMKDPRYMHPEQLPDLYDPILRIPTLLTPLPTPYSHTTPKREVHDVWTMWATTFKVHKWAAKAASGAALAITSSLFPFGLCTFDRWLHPLLSEIH
jgi:hypothetical protein